MFEQPSKLDTLDIVFPADVSHLMPSYDELHEWARTPEATPYLEFQRTWFFRGLAPESEVFFKEGIDGKDAIRHLRAIQGSFEPKHEHKEAGVAWLLSQWSDKPPVAVPATKIGA